MKTISRFMFCIISILIAACGTLEVNLERTPTPDPGLAATIDALQTRVATSDPLNSPLTLESDPETIRRKMLYSHNLWQQVWVDAMLTSYDMEGVTLLQSDHQQVWVDQPTGRFRLLRAPLDQAAVDYVVSDGQQGLTMNLQTGHTESFSAPQIQGFKPPEAVTDTIYTHPLDGALGTSLSAALFPTGLAQRGGSYDPISVEVIAGRTAVVVDWQLSDQGGRIDRFWIDANTGIILRWQNFGKGGGEMVTVEYVINTITYNVSFPDELFQVPPASIPAFALDASGISSSTTPASETPAAGKDPNGELYFTLMNASGSDPNLRLVRLPGSCVMEAAACPEPGFSLIPGYPIKDATALPLTWSPDGSRAVIVRPEQSGMTQTPFFLDIYDPELSSWQSLIRMQVIEQAQWSPDGSWIIFMGFEQNVYDLYVVHPDGTGLLNLTKGQFTGDYTMFIMGGWLANQYLFGFGRQGEIKLYLIDPETSEYRELPVAMPAGKSQFLPAPDGQSIVTLDYSSSGASVNLLNKDGSFNRQLAAFQNVSITLQGWSPDGQWVLFSGLITSDRNGVYLVRRDGTDFRQIYDGGIVGRTIFSPDSLFVVISDSSETGEWLYVYSLDEGKYNILTIPGLTMNDRWLAPSWRPPHA
jgi:hypothetical protein